MTTPLSISDEHLPALFRSADRASLDAQKDCLNLVRLNLLLIICATFATSWAVASSDLRALLSYFSAGAFVAGLVITTISLQTQLSKHWFGARAVAESVKSIAWRYMMFSNPYGPDLPDPNADELFCRELDSILQENRALGSALGGAEASAEQITQQMRNVRQMDWTLRRNIYLRNRIQEQRTWYGSKSSSNARSAKRWTRLVGLAQLGGAVAAIAFVRWPNLKFNLAAVLASAAAGFMAWLKVKQHQELAPSYGLAAHELGLIEARAPSISNEADLSSFVAVSEAAISREHTMWVARRDIGL